MCPVILNLQTLIVIVFGDLHKVGTVPLLRSPVCFTGSKPSLIHYVQHFNVTGQISSIHTKLTY